MRHIGRLVQHGDNSSLLRRALLRAWLDGALVLATKLCSKASRSPPTLAVAPQLMLLLQVAMKLAFAREAFSATCVPFALMHCSAVVVLAWWHHEV